MSICPPKDRGKNGYSTTLCSGSKADATQMGVAVECLNGLQYIHMLENYIANRDEPNATIRNSIILSKGTSLKRKCTAESHV